MKTLTTAMKTHVANVRSTLTECIRITLKDGTVYGFTRHSADITFQSVTYLATAGVNFSSQTSGEDLSPGSLEALGFFSATGVLWNDVKAGKFNSATHELFILNYEDLTAGKIIMMAGPLGEIKAKGSQYSFELKDWLDMLTRNLGEATSPYCRVKRLGDPNCGVLLPPPLWLPSTFHGPYKNGDQQLGARVRPTIYNGFWYKCVDGGISGATEPTWSTTIDGITFDGTSQWKTYDAYIRQGTVTGVIDGRSFQYTASPQAANYFKYGTIKWLTGNNAGREYHVKSNTTGQIDQYTSCVQAIQVGDTYEITKGCDRSELACRGFESIYWFQGEPHKPDSNILISYTTR